jgi:hypothetical protein
VAAKAAAVRLEVAVKLVGPPRAVAEAGPRTAARAELAAAKMAGRVAGLQVEREAINRYLERL